MNPLTAPARSVALLVIATSLACSASTETPSALGVSRSTASATLPGGSTLTVALTEPPTGAVYAPGAEVRVAGTGAVGAATAPRTTLVYVLDASSSAAGGASCGDGGGTVIRCEVLAAKKVNDRAATLGTIGAVGVVGFAAWGAAADMSPLPGEQLVTTVNADADLSGVRDVDQVLASITPARTTTSTMGRIDLFTRYDLGYTTSFAGGLEAALRVVSAGNLPTSTIVFLSDGNDTRGGDTTPVVPAGVTIHAFAVGGNRGCGMVEQGPRDPSLAWIASLGAPGSSCTVVTKMSDLAVLLPAAVSPRLTSVTATVDGASFGPLTLTTTLPAIGPAMVGFELTVPGLAPGRHELCVTATGSDASGAGTATDCATVSVASIALAPATATLDLGVATGHEVVATVSAGAEGIAGVDVAFEIVSGPNAGAASTVATGASGTAAFGYDARPGASGVGTDVIRACFIDASGVAVCAEATATWRGDVTPPEAFCVPGPNPAGRNVPAPRARFFRLVATDEVDPAPTVLLRDSGSGESYGPFPSGTTVKYTLALEVAPSARDIGGPRSAVALHVIGTGAPEVVAIDASGNASTAPCGED